MAVQKNDSIEYNLTRNSRKNINITVKNDGYVYVSAPKKVALSDINKVVLSKSKWILDAQKNIKSKKIIKKEILIRNNCNMYIYGNLVKLKILASDKNILVLKENELLFLVKEEYIEDSRYKNEIFNKLLKLELRNTINKFMKKYLTLLSLEVSTVEIRAMRSRWGTCIPAKKKILFNSNLIHCPKEAIEYVVLHEIAHLIHPNHSKAFYETVASHMKNWQENKMMLQEFVIR